MFKETGDADLDGNLRGGDVFTETKQSKYLPSGPCATLNNVCGFSSSTIKLFSSTKRSLHDGFLIP